MREQHTIVLVLCYHLGDVMLSTYCASVDVQARAEKQFSIARSSLPLYKNQHNALQKHSHYAGGACKWLISNGSLYVYGVYTINVYRKDEIKKKCTGVTHNTSKIRLLRKMVCCWLLYTAKRWKLCRGRCRVGRCKRICAKWLGQHTGSRMPRQ